MSEVNRPLVSGGFWFALTVLGLAGIAYSALPMFVTAPEPPPQIVVKVEPEMLQKALEEALPRFTEEWAFAGAKAYAMLQEKMPKDKITLARVLELARKIKPQMVIDRKKKNEEPKKATVKVKETDNGSE